MKNIKLVLAIVVFSFFSCSKDDDEVQPQTTDLNYSNGSLSTGSTSANGTVAPAGYTWSEIQEGISTIGFSAYGDNLVADDFVVPAGEKWTINKFIFYAYQTNFSGTICPINDVKYTIYNQNPSAAGTTSIFGDFSINKFTSGEDAKIYRISKNAPNSSRKIFKITASATDLVLEPGTYWIKWQTKNTDNTAHFLPQNTTLGSTGLTTYNAIGQYLGAWSVLSDGTNNVRVDFPFGIVGTKTKI